MNGFTPCTPSDAQALSLWLKQAGKPDKRALIGFDGYVDTIYRVVKTRSENRRTAVLRQHR